MEEFTKLSITINDVTKTYHHNNGIKNISTVFEEGILNIIIGDNGSGKSTLLKCIMGLVDYKGQIQKRKHRIGYAPEDYVMPNSMTVIDFLMIIGRIKKEADVELNDQVKYYLEYFNLIEYKHKLIGSLSNGMKQKINLMQAFIHNPKIIILDEPLTSLDLETQDKVLRLINQQLKYKLIVITTHQKTKFKTRNKKIFKFEDGCLINV